MLGGLHSGPVTLHPGGDPDGDGDVLLLHGLANSSSVWKPFVARSASGCRLWSADLPWRGDSDGTWSHGDGLPAKIAEVITALPSPPRVVVAHSFSANLLLALFDDVLASGLDPFAHFGISGVVLVSPFYRADPADFDWDTISYYLTDFPRIMEDGIRVHAAGRLDPELRAEMGRRVAERVGPYGWTSFFTTYLRTPWLRVAELTGPFLVLSGEHDFAAKPEESERLAKALPDARFRVLGEAGHFLMSERPDAFAAEVDAFVREVSFDANENRGTGTPPRTVTRPRADDRPKEKTR
jgi:pimeloyl-ACP methyl ester carboxylesterase